jgi:hypothetical protein
VKCEALESFSKNSPVQLSKGKRCGVGGTSEAQISKVLKIRRCIVKEFTNSTFGRNRA